MQSRIGGGDFDKDSSAAQSSQGPAWTGRPKPASQVQKTRPFVAAQSNQSSQQEISSDLALIFEKRRKALQEAEDLEYYGGKPPSPPSENPLSAPRRWSAPTTHSSPPTIPDKPNSARSAALTVRFASDLEPPAQSAHADAVDHRGRNCDGGGEDAACGGGGRIVTRAGRAYLKEDGRLIPIAPAEQPPSPPPPPPPYPPPSGGPSAWESFKGS
jgi:hypothetical protein